MTAGVILDLVGLILIILGFLVWKKQAGLICFAVGFLIGFVMLVYSGIRYNR